MNMKYNAKYDRWVTVEGKVYRRDKQGNFVECKQTTQKNGYKLIRVTTPKNTGVYVHRLVYETFIGEIPLGLEIDHLNTVRSDNCLNNLRCVTRKENLNNPLSLKHLSEAGKGRVCSPETIEKLRISLKGKNKGKPSWVKGKQVSEFGKKFYEHYKLTYSENPKLYKTEHQWYRCHNKICRWETE